MSLTAIAETIQAASQTRSACLWLRDQLHGGMVGAFFGNGVVLHTTTEETEVEQHEGTWHARLCETDISELLSLLDR